MKSVKISIKNFDSNIDAITYDILCVQHVQYTDIVIGCSIVDLELHDKDSLSTVIVKFEWVADKYELDEDDFCFIPETGVLFFRSLYQWGVIDIKNKSLKRHEFAFDIPTIYKEDGFVLIHDELYAESVRFNGNKIDNVPIDPPYEMKEYEDRIEYTSIIFGHQILKTR